MDQNSNGKIGAGNTTVLTLFHGYFGSTPPPYSVFWEYPLCSIFIGKKKPRKHHSKKLATAIASWGKGSSNFIGEKFPRAESSLEHVGEECPRTENALELVGEKCSRTESALELVGKSALELVGEGCR